MQVREERRVGTRLAPCARHARAFGLFYTVLLASGAVAPILFGAVGDAMGLETSFAIIALLAGCIILICPFLSPRIAEPSRS